MVFHKPPCNNREVPLYSFRKLWEEFLLGYHVNYFDIGDFQWVGLGSAQDQEGVRCDPMLGPFPSGEGLAPLSNILPLQRD
jgi:hypothetical protein